MDHEVYIERALEEIRKYKDSMAARKAAGLEIAKRIAVVLANRLGVTSVKLVGSLSKPDVEIGPESDIDLLIAGLPDTDYLKAFFYWRRTKRITPSLLTLFATKT